METPKTTLITAVGSASAGAVNSRLHALGHRVIGCDIYPRAWNLTSQKVDAFFQSLPAAQEEAYLAQLLDATQRHGADYLIPLTDVEVDALSPHRARLLSLGCTLCAPEAPVARLCRDKRKMAALLEKHGVCPTIPTFSPYGWEPGDGDFPLMLKPLSGRSSQGQAVVRTREAFFSALAAREDYIAQPFLDGDIYTVDVARDARGRVQTLARHELLRTGNGLGTTVDILPEHPLNAVCARIAEVAGIVGVVNMEFICHQGAYFFLEVNPRFSGGVGFSVAAGVDFPALCIRCYSSEDIGERGPARAGVFTREISVACTKEEK